MDLPASRKRPSEEAPCSEKRSKLSEITNCVAIDCDAETEVDEEEVYQDVSDSPHVSPLRMCVGCGLVWDGSAQCMGGEDRCGETVEVE